MATIFAKILADSQHPNGSRLTTFELTYPRFIHSELMTHRKFSRNSASSRAIPTKVLMRQVMKNPVVPIHWGKLQKGMQAETQLSGLSRFVCRQLWLKLRWVVLAVVWVMLKMKLHKQIANRLLEPWMLITVIVTSDERGLANWFKLRDHEAAEPHIQMLAFLMSVEMVYGPDPKKLSYGDWHLPFINEYELREYCIEDCVSKSVARCARGSYLQQHGDFTFEDDVKLGNKLSKVGHWSAFEHQAMCSNSPTQPSNFVQGWIQNRKQFIGEDGC